LYIIRSALVLFAFKNCFDIFPYFTSLLSEDTLAYESTGIHSIFNDTFYKNLSKYPDLMLCVIESINHFIRECTLQYEVIYPIIKSIIMFNESSDIPIKSEYLNFMTVESVQERYKNQINLDYSIILPYSIKFDDYCHEPLPSYTIFITVNRAKILDSIFSLDTFEDVPNAKFHITFENEPGIDAGGLTRDFVDISWKELAKSNLFIPIENGYLWFNYFSNPSPEILRQYKCVGFFFALCIKNKLTIPVRFPPFFYKKMKNLPFKLYDLLLYNHDIGESIQNMMTSLVPENTIAELTFLVKEKKDGEIITHEFDVSQPYPNFVDITDDLDWEVTPLTENNKFDYAVNAVDLIFNFSVEKQWEKFVEGYLMVPHSEMIDKSFRLDELDILVSGQNVINWDAFKRNSVCSSSKRSVKWFWEIFNSWNEQRKLGLLKFVSGTTAIPIGGIESLIFSIDDIPYDSVNPFPRSHTCFCTLDLPMYRTKEEEERILTNIVDSSEFITYGMG